MNHQRRGFIHKALALGGAALMPVSQALSQVTAPFIFEDVAGRKVTLKHRPARIFLGEGNLFYTVAALCRENPLEKLIGWRDNFRTADLDSYHLYCRYFPELARLPTFSGIQQLQFNLEKLIGLRPDIMVLNLNTRSMVETSGLAAKLNAANIPIAYVDMSIHLMANTARSITLMGQLFDQTERAALLNQYRDYHLGIITQRLMQEHPLLPRVLMERAAGLYDECCLSWGNANFGELVTAAGGNNLAASIIHNTYGALSPEQIIASNPDKILVTGSNWSQYSPNGNWVNLGPNADLALAKEKLERLMQRPAYRTLSAAKKRKVYAIWHPFYDHPFSFIAVLQLAKWFHPHLFNDISADHTFSELFARFLPVPWEPGYWVSLDTEST
ncbi:ABC transporter substrate-binding protein [Candidatus Pantoea multigeneris]|nr:ABC transporter substrate-binding protein [Pantoea multigeneris]